MANAIITITGNLGADAEVTTLPSGKQVTNLKVAVTPRKKRGDDWVDLDTMWFRVTAWEGLEPLVYAKGAKVLVTGQLTTSTYEAKDGTQKTSFEISADAVGIVTRRATEATTGGFKAPAEWTPVQNDDMPF